MGERERAGSSRGMEAARRKLGPCAGSHTPEAVRRKDARRKPRAGSRAPVVHFFCLDNSDPGKRVRVRVREGKREGRERESGTSAFSLYDVVTVNAKIRLCCRCQPYADRCQPYTG